MSAAIPFFGTGRAVIISEDSVLHISEDTLKRVLLDSLKINSKDTLSVRNSLKTDSLRRDSVSKPKSGFDAIVNYTAKDSLVLYGNNWGYLYGESEVKYQDITLKSEKISINMDSNLVHASYGLDSIGKEFGYPVFSEKGSEYEAKTINYNFKTKKGYIRNVVTQQGEGYIVAGRAKKTEDDAFFMREGRYTTCDLHDHPHFYIALTKAKVRPKKNVVTGPAYLVIEDLPIPFIGLPFGFFPFTDKYSSGVIMPSFGTEMARGYNLREGGYYFAMNDNMDLALTGDIYTKGSWGVNAASKYIKRYKYSGNFSLSYLVTKTGDAGIDETKLKDTRISWTHSQDSKANAYRTLSASVNYSTSQYNRNNLSTLYTPESTVNTKSSTVNMTQRFPNSPWTISGSMSVNQISSDSSISVTLPNMVVTMSRIAPFKRKEAVGSERWYEKIQLSYTGDLRNSVTTKEDKLFESNLQKDWRKAMKHTVPVSATYSAFNYLNITPALNYTERWYTRKIMKDWDASRNALVASDTTYGFNRVYDYNLSLSLQTKLYGMYKPLIASDKIQAIRHVFTPSVSFTYSPSFADPTYGYYEKYAYYDSDGNKTYSYYSPYSSEIFGVPSAQKTNMISFQFDNNVEMKVKSDKDSTGFKKISLIDQLGISFSYNAAADSFKWSNITTNLRLKLSKSLTVNLNSTFDPYLYDGLDSNGRITTNPDDVVRLRRVDKLRVTNHAGIGRLQRTGFSISPSINQDTFKKWFGKETDGDKKKDQANNTPKNSSDAEEGTERKSMFEHKKDEGEYDADGYLKNAVKWSLGISYSVNYAYNTSRIDVSGKRFEYKRDLTHNLSFNGNIQPTKNWNFSFNSSYDFDAGKIAYMNCTLSRDLHCWNISASFIPVGPYKSYYVSIRASSSLLQDLKYESRGRSSSYDPSWD